VTLTRQQVDALRQLKSTGGCETSKRTWGPYLAGTTVAALVRRGLVKYRGDGVYGITDAGIAELTSLEAT
jgi:hypothetical protein